jgi:hypothetical protein
MMFKSTVLLFGTFLFVFSALFSSMPSASAAQQCSIALKPKWADFCAYYVPCDFISVTMNGKVTKRASRMCGGWQNKRGTRFTTKGKR